MTSGAHPPSTVQSPIVNIVNVFFENLNYILELNNTRKREIADGGIFLRFFYALIRFNVANCPG